MALVNSTWKTSICCEKRIRRLISKQDSFIDDLFSDTSTFEEYTSTSSSDWASIKVLSTDFWSRREHKTWHISKIISKSFPEIGVAHDQKIFEWVQV